MKEIKGNMIAKGRTFAIVVSRFNEFISKRLLDGAVETLLSHGASDGNITSVWVPGSFEIPPVAQKLARSKKYDAVICLGAVLRGDTPHFDFIANEASKGIAKISLDEKIPCVFGVITTDTLEQAIDRAGAKSGNKGRDAARTAIEMVDLFDKI